MTPTLRRAITGAAGTELGRSHPPMNLVDFVNLLPASAFQDLWSAVVLRRLREKPEPGEPSVPQLLGELVALQTVADAHVRAVLQRCGGSRKKSAAILGVGMRTLFRYADRLDVPPVSRCPSCHGRRHGPLPCPNSEP